MSGGAFEYKQFHIDGIIDSLENLIDFESQKFKPETLVVFKEALRHLHLARIYTHEIDLVLSYDNCEESLQENIDKKRSLNKC